jgi:ATP-binding cassette subfamily B (MDR/TAP) protein 1
MILGTIGAIGQGATMPSFSLIFGMMLDALNKTGTSDFLDEISHISLYFVYAGIGSFVATTGM